MTLRERCDELPPRASEYFNEALDKLEALAEKWDSSHDEWSHTFAAELRKVLEG